MTVIEDEKQSGRASSLIMAAGTLLSRVLGFVKLGLTLFILGTSTDISDSFSFANQTPNLLYILIGGGALNSILVPQIVQASKAKDKGEAYINKLLTMVVIIMGLGTLALMAMTWKIVQIMGSGWSPDRKGLTEIFLLWCLPQIFFYGLYTIFGQVLNARSVYGPYMWAPVLNNVVAILGIFAFMALFGSVAADNHAVQDWNQAKTTVLLGSTTLGVILQAIILIVPMSKLGYKVRPSFGWRGMGFRETGKVASWALALVTLNQLAYFVIFWVAANAGNARHNYPNPESIPGNASYDSSSLIINFPHSIVAVSIATVLFTRMSYAAEEGDINKVRTNLSQAQRLVAVITVFSTMLFVVLSGPIGMVVSGSTVISGVTMGHVILSMALSAPLISANFIFQRVFYAFKDSRTPFMIQVPVSIALVLMTLACNLLPPPYIIIGMSISASINLAMAIFIDVKVLKKTLGTIDGPRITQTFVRVAVAGIFSSLFGFAALWLLGGYNTAAFPWHGRWQAFVTGVIVASIMSLIYAVTLKRMHVQEFTELAAPAARKLGLGRFF